MNLLIIVFLIFGPSALDANQTVKDSCPPEAVDIVGENYFRVYGDFCFLFNTYDKTYIDHAHQKCQQHGGTLAMPKTKVLNDFLVKELTSTYRASDPFWIGLSDVIEDGEMVWDDGSKVEWKNFDYYNGGLFGFREDCIALDPEDGTWHDYRCEQSYFFSTAPKPFICQYGKVKADS